MLYGALLLTLTRQAGAGAQLITIVRLLWPQPMCGSWTWMQQGSTQAGWVAQAHGPHTARCEAAAAVDQALCCGQCLAGKQTQCGKRATV